MKVSIGSDFSIGDCGNGREKSATDGRYICVCLLCIHTLSGFSQHTHTQPSVCVCVWYSSKSARTGHVSFSQTLSTERNGLYLTSALNCLSCFSLAPSSVCVCVCVRLPISIYNLVEYIHIHSSPPSIQPNRILH